MKIVFWHSDKPRERLLANAFRDGAIAAGDEVELRRLQPHIEVADADVVCMVGVKSRELFRAHFDSGVHIVYFDKGYTRHAVEGPIKLWEYWRVSLDAHQPTERLMKREMPGSRAEALHLVMQNWRKSGKNVVIAGSSAKYQDFYKMSDPTAWTQKVIKQIRATSGRTIIYRPKPSWREAVPIEGTVFSHGKGEQIEDVLKDAWVLVTHGSNAVFEAQMLGVPCIVLGDAVAKPISSTELDQVENPRLASWAERHTWLNNLMWWQWTLPEMAAGEMWQFVRPQIYGA